MWDPIHLCPSRQDDDGARGGDDDDHHGLHVGSAEVSSRAGRRRSAGRWCARDRAGPRVTAQRSVEVRSGVNAAGCLPACLSVDYGPSRARMQAGDGQCKQRRPALPPLACTVQVLTAARCHVRRNVTCPHGHAACVCRPIPSCACLPTTTVISIVASGLPHADTSSDDATQRLRRLCSNERSSSLHTHTRACLTALDNERTSRLRTCKRYVTR
jgi:hypothetical protein